MNKVKIFHELHCQRYSAHLGRDHTIEAIKLRFFWPNMSGDIALWARQCDLTARWKLGPHKGKTRFTNKVYIICI